MLRDCKQSQLCVQSATGNQDRKGAEAGRDFGKNREEKAVVVSAAEWLPLASTSIQRDTAGKMQDAQEDIDDT